MSLYKFKKGDKGKTLGGYDFEVVAELKAPGPLVLPLAVVITHADGSDALIKLTANGRWHRNNDKHHMNLVPPTTKVWVVRAEYTNEQYGGVTAISWEHSEQDAAERNANSARNIPGSYKNVTIEEKEVVLCR